MGAWECYGSGLESFSSRVVVDRKCHSWSLSDHEKVRGHLAWQVVRASCWISLETEFGGERPIANIGDRNGS